MTKQSLKAQLLVDNSKACAEAAFEAGESEAKLAALVFSACGSKPNLQTFDAIRHSVICGLMASALARKGDNRKSSEIIAHCATLLTKYQGFTGTAPVRDGMLGRRTEEQEKAYTSARVRWAGIVKAAEVTVPGGKSGGANNPKGAPAKGNAKASAVIAQGSAKVKDIIPTPKFSNEKQAISWSKREAAAMLATINGSAKHVPSWLKSAVADFHAAVKKQSASETPAA